MKNVLSIIGVILICVIFPPVLIILVPYIIYLLITKNKGDINHMGGKEWTKIDDVVIKDNANKVVFDFYKNILLDYGKNLQESLNDQEISKEFGNVAKSEYDRIIGGGIEDLLKGVTKEEK